MVYDPFYCAGAAEKRLKSLGFHTVVHRNEDFWRAVAQHRVPQYDVLVTNPPYSGDHKERIVEFCVATGKPWALLMPNYVAVKGYYTMAVNGSAGETRSHHHKPFYIAPIQRSEKYHYTHPEGTGHNERRVFLAGIAVRRNAFHSGG